VLPGRHGRRELQRTDCRRGIAVDVAPNLPLVSYAIVVLCQGGKDRFCSNRISQNATVAGRICPQTDHSKVESSTPATLESGGLGGRLSLAQRLTSKGAFRVSVGSSWTKLADVNIDIRKEMRPDIVGDALCLPLRSEIADEVLFTDVIEHLPVGTETRALREIQRILRDSGSVIISTPSGRTIFKLLDPSWYFEGHRHYSFEKLADMIQQAGLFCTVHFESGFVATMLWWLWYVLLVYPHRRIFHVNMPDAPGMLHRVVEREYRFLGKGRYTVFVVARK